MEEYKGYKVTQVPNNHVVITKDGKLVMHVQCNKPKTDDELKDIVKLYIELTQGGGLDNNQSN